MGRTFIAVVMTATMFPIGLSGIQKSVDQQIEEAVNPLSRGDRGAATVLGYTSGSDTLEVIRPGTNEFICLADEPGTDRFMVSCYHKTLEPFMARGRELRGQGLSRDDARDQRDRELAAGSVPIGRASLISLIGRINPETGQPDSVNALRVLYLPNATIEETGLARSGRGGAPWLMEPGTPRAHLMIPGERRPFKRQGRRRGGRRDAGPKKIGQI
jgi:hypothetical protein